MSVAASMISEYVLGPHDGHVASNASIFYGPTPAATVPWTILDPRGNLKRVLDLVVVMAALYMAAVLPCAPAPVSMHFFFVL